MTRGFILGRQSGEQETGRTFQIDQGGPPHLRVAQVQGGWKKRAETRLER